MEVEVPCKVYRSDNTGQFSQWKEKKNSTPELLCVGLKPSQKKRNSGQRTACWWMPPKTVAIRRNISRQVYFKTAAQAMADTLVWNVQGRLEDWVKLFSIINWAWPHLQNNFLATSKFCVWLLKRRAKPNWHLALAGHPKELPSTPHQEKEEISQSGL